MDMYKQDGVNISAGDTASMFAGQVCRDSYGNSPFVEVLDLSCGNFRGPRGFALKGLPAACILTCGADGVGTKVGIIGAAGTYIKAADDVFAMTAMDITRWGGIPLIFSSVLDVSSLGEVDSPAFENCLEIYAGMGKVARKHGYVIITGETAELGAFVGSENPDAAVKFNLAGFMIGAYHPDKMIRGDSLMPGQKVIVLGDTFRSNGISSVRKALAIKYGPKWWDNPLALESVARAATPSVQYDRPINQLHGWFDPSLRAQVRLHLVVHLSGGAFKGKFGELLKMHSLSADLTDLFDPPEIMRQCAEWRGMSSEACYETWNGGQGALLVVDDGDVRQVIDVVRSAGINAKVAGEIKRHEGYTVAITSKFDGKRVQYF